MTSDPSVPEHSAEQDGTAALDAFLSVRPQLFGIAYRMLGGVAEAEDVLQDTWIRWQSTDRSRVKNPAAFLTTVATRLSINATTSAYARRETYVGPWLPEPVDTSEDPALGAERAEALEVAVLVLLERLTPVERAVYVLREAFGYPYRRVAETLGLTETNARQLARRSRDRLGSRDAVTVDRDEHRRLLGEFLAAARDGDLSRFEQFLAEEVVARSDGGGRVHAARVDLVGAERVSLFFGSLWRKYGDGVEASFVEANGRPALSFRRDGTLTGLLSLEVTAAGIEHMFIQVNPDKLAGFAP
ncbi:RNA polymerase ECF family sigma subunit [Isoptericola sp. CG 20/1183]|uniref:RNA polymerase ECF family sigma subunit n=1 Tax=Isoptericola halotolerans TaxID=300560 RepID=A0ABX5EG85_9MICO|nr:MULTISPECIES: RNA polymerase sigma factor SigJ [Isoptericola]PRZ08259.1 RNA polymerase ECF family sigma subunit [Isoptericola halotolerans]PRZ09056.1 RNA polymerase ECF family sigma subunit [Isoptericola sp. CG 20/1183]